MASRVVGLLVLGVVAAALVLPQLAAGQGAPVIPYSYIVEGCLNIVAANGSLVPVPPGLNVTFWYNGSLVNWTETRYVNNSATGTQCWGYAATFSSTVNYTYFEVYVESVYAGNITNMSELYPGSGIYYARTDFNLSDTEPPAPPSNLTVSWVNETVANISWSPSSDNLAVRGYYYRLVDYYGNVVASGFTNETSWTTPPLEDGRYTFTVYATDYAGWNSSAANVSFMVNTEAPVVVIVSPANGSVLATSSVGVEALACDAVGIANASVLLDGSPLASSMSLVNATCVAVSASASVGDGWHNVTVVAYDNGGVAGSASSVFLVDTVPPSVAIVSPGNGSIETGTPVWFQVNASDTGSGVNASSLAVLVDGSPATPLNVSTSVNGSTIVFSFAVDMAAGWHTIAVGVSDNAGNTGYANVSLGVDLEAPAVEPASPAPGSFVGKAGAQPAVLAVNASDDLGLSTAVFYVNGSLAGSYNFSGSSSGVASVEYWFNTSGYYVATAVVVDLAGRSSNASWGFTVDLEPPLLASVSPANGSVVDGGSLVFTAVLADNYGVNASSVVLSVDGSPVPVNVTVSGANATVSAVLSLGEGWHNLTLAAADLAGNSVVYRFVYGVDLSPPAITIVSPANGSFVGGKLTVNATVGDSMSGVNASTISVLVDGVPVNYTATLSGDVYVVTASVTGLSEGDHNITVSACDLVGNCASATVYVTVDTVAPTVTIVSPVNGTITGNSSLLIEAYACDDNSVDSVAVSVDGSPLTASVAPVNATCVHVTAGTTVGEGWHTVTISACDPAGNCALKQSTVGVDLSGPVVVFVSPANGSVLAAGVNSFEAVVSDNLSGVNASSLAVLVDGSPATPVSLNVSGSGGNLTVVFELNVTGGWHSVELVAYDNVGNAGSGSVVVAGDAYPPSVAPVEPVNGSLLGPGSNCVNVTAAASDDIGVVSAVLAVDGVVVGNYTLPLLPAANVSAYYCFNTTGWHNASATVWDAVGRNASVSWSFYVDLTPPAVEPVTLANGSIVGSSNVSIALRVDDDYAVNTSSVEAYIDGSPAAYTVSTVNGSVVVEVYATGLSDGWHNLTLLVADLAGNTAVYSMVFGVDTTPPLAAIFEPVNGSLVASMNVSVRGSIVDGFSGVNASTVAVLVDGDAVEANLTPVPGGFNVSALAAWLPDGVHKITLSGCDLAGNCANATVYVTVDTSPPSITVYSPEQRNYTEATVPVSAVACDENGVAEFYAVVDGSLRINGSLVNETCMAVNTSVTLDMGSHLVEFYAVDSAGNNASTAVSFYVLIDVVPPVIVSLEPEPGSLAAGPNVSIRVLACDSGSGIDASATQLVVDGAQVPVAGSDPVNATCTLIEAVAVLSDGWHNASVTVYDYAGNNASSSWSFAVDATPPSLVVESPVNGSWYNASTVWVSVKASDNYAVASLELMLNGTPVNATVSGLGSSSASATATLSLGDGWYVLEAAASDGVGHNASLAVGFGVDTVPPSVAIVSPANGSLLAYANVTIAARVADNTSGIASVEVYVDGAPVNASMVNGTVTAAVTLSDGWHNASVKACDAAGWCTVAYTVFGVDTTPPSIVFAASNGTVFYKDVVWVNGTIIDANIGSGVPAINSSLFELAYWDPATGRFAFRNTSSLADGNYSVEVVYTDAAGNTGSAVLVFGYVNARHINVTVYKGWNLLGISLEPVYPSIEKVFDELLARNSQVAIYYWNATTQQWLLWTPIIPNPALREVHVGMGLWVYVNTEEPITFRLWGLPEEARYRLAVGWNLVAVTATMSPGDFMPDVDWSMIIGYDASTGTYTYYIRGFGGSLTVLEPGKGYWLKVNSLPPT